MTMEVLGCDGGKQEGKFLVTMRLGDRVLLDAGSAASLSNEEQKAVEKVLISHAHLDHVHELGFLADTRLSQTDASLEVYGSRAAISIIREHYMNDLLWPDFSRIVMDGTPAMIYREFVDYDWLELGDGLAIMPVPVNHGAGGRGFLIRSKTACIAYSGDTGPTEDIWRLAAEQENLALVVVEVSFPDGMESTALASDHLTPSLLATEMKKLDRDVPIYAFHLKPWFRHEIVRDLSRHFIDRAVLLLRGERIEF
ncbi:3',5'-cyclic-nucleotide phosphodiesterase [Candidatus Fermentibacterales bacterium]|nr:3',5'-cyclic-nucleotide phosphodiesterase [Candidatus Fermentibacterales bacterium]